MKPLELWSEAEAYVLLDLRLGSKCQARRLPIKTLLFSVEMTRRGCGIGAWRQRYDGGGGRCVRQS